MFSKNQDKYVDSNELKKNYIALYRTSMYKTIKTKFFQHILAKLIHNIHQGQKEDQTTSVTPSI